MTLYNIYTYCYVTSMIGVGLAILTLLFSSLGKKTITLQDGQEVLRVECGRFKLYASTLQLLTLIFLSIIILPLGAIFYLYKEHVIPINPHEVCQE